MAALEEFPKAAYAVKPTVSEITNDTDMMTVAVTLKKVLGSSASEYKFNIC